MRDNVCWGCWGLRTAYCKSQVDYFMVHVGQQYLALMAQSVEACTKQQITNKQYWSIQMKQSFSDDEDDFQMNYG